MFTAIGHEVLTLNRVSVGGLTMAGLPDGEWKYLTQADIEAVFSGPTTEEVLAEQFRKHTSTSGTRLMESEERGQQPQVSIDSSSSSSSQTNPQARPPLVKDSVGKDREPTLISDLDESGEGEEEGTAINETVKKLRQDERWRRRRLALKKMVKNM